MRPPRTPVTLEQAARAGLAIAAPSAALDPLAPWMGAHTASQRVLAATFWTSFGGLSGFLHLVAIFCSLAATLLPIPLLSDACAPVRPVVKPTLPVVMSIVEVKPEPVLEVPPPPPPPPPPAEERARSAAAKAKRQRARVEEMEMGMLALLGSAPATGGVFGGLDSVDHSSALGALMGEEIGVAFGAGGLGLSGVGEGGGGRGEGIGLGSIGTIGHGGGVATGQGYGSGALSARAGGARVDVVDTDLDRAPVRRALLGRNAVLAACNGELPVDVTLRVRDGKVAKVDGAAGCVSRALRGTAIRGAVDGYAAVHIEAL